MSDLDREARGRLAPVLDRLPVDVERSLEAVTKRVARRTLATRVATVGVAAVLAAAGFWAVARFAVLGGGETRPGASGEGAISYMRVSLQGAEEVVGSFVARPDGSGSVRLAGETEWMEFPALSPDGTMVAFVGAPAGGGDSAARNLYVSGSDGSEARLLVEGGVGRGSISWSPDGRQVAFVRDEGREGHYGSLWVVNADGSEPRRVLRGSWEDVAWSPDGSRFALTGQLGYDPCRQGVCGSPEETGLHVVGADGSGLQQVTRPEFVTRPDLDGDERWRGFARFPTWSPDSERIAFALNREADDVAIYVIRADGSGLEKVTDAPGADTGPVWSPDGRSILFSSVRHLLEREQGDILRLSLFLLDLRTGETRMLVDAGDGALLATSWIA